jgi:DNA-binding MarR family transcriptional regulator
VANDIRERVADNLLAMLPFYHRHIFKAGAGVSGIRIAQYRALGMLIKSGPLSMSELGRLLYISKPYMTVLADTLVENGWAERKSDPDDRRVIRIAITPVGKKHLQQAFEIYRADVKTLITSLDAVDLQRLSAALEDLQNIFAKLEG